MANRLIVLSSSYRRGEAETIHNVSFLRAYSDLGLDVTIGYFFPDGYLSHLEDDYDIPRVKTVYFWKKLLSRNKVLRHLWKHLSYGCFFLSLKKGDVVFLTGSAQYLPMLVRWGHLRGFHVFHEKNEHPDVHCRIGWKFLRERYLPACTQLDGLFVISNPLKEFFVSEGVPADKVHVLNMVVDPSRFEGVKKNSHDHCIAYCGNVKNKKDGVDILIRSFAKVVESLGESMPDMKLKIIGVPPEDDKSENVSLVKELGLTERVVFTGFVDPKDMPQVLTDASVLALSRPDNLQAKHGFPTKLGEYLLTGNPVVVTAVGDIPLFLKDGESAFVCTPGDVDEFAAKLVAALTDSDKAALIGARGRQVALENFNYLTEGKKIVKVFDEYLGR